MFLDSNGIPVLLYGTEEKFKNHEDESMITTTLTWINLNKRLSSLLARRGLGFGKGSFSNFGRAAKPTTVLAAMNFPRIAMKNPHTTNTFMLAIIGSTNSALGKL